MTNYNTSGDKGKERYCIYLIYNHLSGKLYVGQSKNPYRRWKRHQSISRRTDQKYHNAIHFALAKYGIENFSFKIVNTNLSLEQSNKYEKKWIAELKSLRYQLYNETDGGEGVAGYEISEEERQRRSDVMKGENNYFYGKKLTGELNGHYGHKMKPHVKDELLKHRAKITKQQAEKLKELYDSGGYTQTELAKKFNISLTQAHRIIHDKRWHGDKNKRGPITKKQMTLDDAKKIKQLYSTGGYTQKEIADMFDVSAGHVHKIIVGKKWPEA